MEDKGRCGGVLKQMSGERIDERRRTSRTICHRLVPQPTSCEMEEKGIQTNTFFFCLMAAWLNEVVVRAVALLSALTKEFTMHIIL